MKIVIDISDEDYNVILANAEFYKEQHWGVAEVWDAIVSGTPLPKGHGRLIDGDALYKLFEQDNFIWEADSYILTAPTIIKADRGEEA